ncbi:MAG: 2-C-methyl-D-erythritol 4-phosphate cytidylyltransferase [Methylococcaceae bacterium]
MTRQSQASNSKASHSRAPSSKIWAIVPAAGVGKRMQSNIPKQYLPLNERPVLEHTLNILLENKNISGLVIALQVDDAYWSDIKIHSEKTVLRAEGGSERVDSVLSALKLLSTHELFNAETDWVMVHDAVRPCLQHHDINKLVREVETDDGGLLALPVRDTMKRQAVVEVDSVKSKPASTRVEKTIDRENLWHALTPQYFPAVKLKQALEKAQQNKQRVTDESSAMEMLGFSPRLVTGDETNIKITRPDDLGLAALYLSSQS